MYIRDLLRTTSSLEILDMSCNNVGDDGMSVILKELEHNNILTGFKIENCGLSVKGILFLATCSCKLNYFFA